MKELSLFNIIGSALMAVADSKVILLIVLELMVLLANVLFSKLMNKKIVNITCLVVSLILLGFYSINYLNTLKIFIDNVSTKAVEMIYFPTTLEFVIVMILSLAIMIFTLVSKKTNSIVKVINVSLPLIISFIFLCIIENVNKSGIDFTEFSIFTDTTLMSLHELAMGLFVAWIIGLGLYKVDTYIIGKAVKEVEDKEYEYKTVNSLTVEQINSESIFEEDLEMPRLKG